MSRSTFNPPRIGRVAWATLPLALIVAGVMASRGEASILQVDFATDADDVLAVLDDGSGSSSTSPADDSRSTPPQGPEEDSQGPTPFTLQHGAPNSGGSTSSSSSGGASTGGGMSFDLSAQIVVNDDDTSTRLAFGQSFSLPTPPETELLRPPRV